MPFQATPLIVLALAGAPFVLAARQDTQAPKMCEEVYKDIRVFKGVPASDLIPAMEFMSASMKVKCNYCHEANDFAAETPGKATGRDMVLLQRNINEKFFDGRLSVTCMTCHNGKEHPDVNPVPDGTNLRHPRYQTDIEPKEFFSKHLAAIGKEPESVVRKGTLTMPAEKEGESMTMPTELTQAPGGKFRMTGFGTIGSNGKQVWRDGEILIEEPAAIFGRMGRSWRGDKAFTGIDQTRVSGHYPATGSEGELIVVRGMRTETGSTEDLYFDSTTNLLTRYVNMTRSTLGTVVSTYEYLDYADFNGTKMPKTIVITFAGGEKWKIEFTSTTVGGKVDDSMFEPKK